MNKRQKKLLKLIVKEYIKKAEPVSSQYLSKRHDLGVCSATVRLDMAELTEEGAKQLFRDLHGDPRDGYHPSKPIPRHVIIGDI